MNLRALYLIGFILVSFMCSYASNPWTLVSEVNQEAALIEGRTQFDFPALKYAVFDLDENQVSSILGSAPETLGRSFDSEAVIPIPFPDGDFTYFRLGESSVMDPQLASRFPQIKSYRAVSEFRSGWAGRISYSPFGMNAVLQTERGELFIEPYHSMEPGRYVVYFSRDVILDDELRHSLSCGVDAVEEYAKSLEKIEQEFSESPFSSRTQETVLALREYRLALATTSAYSSLKGGTIESVMSSLNTAVNLLNEILEREVAVRMVLISDNDKLIWLDPNDEPYQNINNGIGLLGQNTDAITISGGISFNRFDVGHVFTGGCSDVGGVVGGQACTPGKARGVTCHASNNIGFIVRRIMAHEIAHQFAVAHTWDFCPGSEGQRAGGSAFEPGSGSTIMSYAGSCGSQNVQGNNHNYFHVRSLEQFIFFSRFSSVAGNCAQLVSTGNTEPVITLDYEDGFFIPINTPFKLTASAYDQDGDNITYCWEQYDLSSGTPLGEPFGDAPLFRSYEPVNNPTRYFPRLADVIGGNNSLFEQLPTYSRNLRFRCTVRDDFPEGAAAVWDQVNFLSTASAGPFRVNYPNHSSQYSGGELMEVIWDVANTNQHPVNCKAVDILLSTNGGFTYSHILMENAPNNGYALVNLPDVSGNNNRIKVRAADNIFFNISAPNFVITELEDPTFVFSYRPYQGLVCSPNILEIPYSVLGLRGFSDTVNVQLITELPEEATILEFPNFLLAGQDGQMVFDLTDVNFTGDQEWTFLLINGEDTLSRTIFLELASTDFSDLELSYPASGVSGVEQNITFRWDKSANASAYDFQVATNPSFSQQFIVHQQMVGDLDSLLPNVFFEANRIYYWRVRPLNVCGVSDNTPIAAFQTRTLSCEEYTATDLPINLPGNSLRKWTSVINLNIDGEVTELNLPIVRGLQPGVGEISASLISPEGTKVSLFFRRCLNLSHFNLGFDDNSNLPLLCPLDNYRIVNPEGDLAEFKGESLRGEWRLEVERHRAGGGNGVLQEWKLAVCANVLSGELKVLRNDTLFAPFLERTTIGRDLLRTEEISLADDIVFTVVEPPSFGELILGEETIVSGTIFTQQDINQRRLRYRAEVEDEKEDYFTFTVFDDRSNWNGIEKFNIAIRADAISSTTDFTVRHDQLKVFPNPAHSVLFIEAEDWMTAKLEFSIMDMAGRILKNGQIEVESIMRLDLESFPSGFYLLNIESGEYRTTANVVISK